MIAVGLATADGGPAVLRRGAAVRARRALRHADRRAAGPPAAGVPLGRPGRGAAARVTVAAGYVMATVLHAPQVLLGDEHGIADAPDVVDVSAVLELAVELAVILATVVLLARRRRAASRVERRGLDPVLLLGAVIVALGGVFLVVQKQGDAARVPVRVRAAARARSCSGSSRSRFFRTAAVGRLIEGLTADHGAGRGARRAAHRARRPDAGGRVLAAGRGALRRRGRRRDRAAAAGRRARGDRDRPRRPARGRARPRGGAARRAGAAARGGARPRRWRSRTGGSRSSCARGWRRCGPRGRGSSRRATPSAGG